MTIHPGLDDVLAAGRRIRDVVRITPLVEGGVVAERLGVSVRLKAECLQETGSFKVRGAANALLVMPPGERAAGVVAVSSGNHGRAVAHVARLLGIPATICLSARVPDVKVDAIRDLDARVVVAGPDQDSAEAEARRLVADEGLTFVHPFDDPMVIAGQGTIGPEVVAEWPEVVTFVVPLSGGGLISGIAAAVKALVPSARVVGVSQDRGPAMYRSLREGRLTPVVEEDTLADALAGGLGDDNRHTFAMCRDLVDDVVLVSEDEIAGAMRLLRRDFGLTVEGGGAVGVAAAMAGRVEPSGPTVIVVSGGNVAPETMARVVLGDSGQGGTGA